MSTISDIKKTTHLSTLRTPLFILAGVIVLLVGLVFGARFLGYASAHESTDDAMIDSDQVQIQPKISERVATIYTDTNRYVARGEILLKLDDVDERTRLEQAVANRDALRAQARAAAMNADLTRATQIAQDQESGGSIEQAQAQIASAGEEASSQVGQIAVAAAGVDGARAQLKMAQAAIVGADQTYRSQRSELRRTEELVSSGDEARASLDTARANAASAASQYAQAESQIANADAGLAQAQEKEDAQRYAASSTATQIDVQRATLTTAQGKYAESAAPQRVSAQRASASAAYAQVRTAQAQVDQAKINLGYTVIRSPISGYVGSKNVEIGATVQPGQSLITLIPSGGAHVTANYKETQIGKMRVGDHVDITVDAYHGVPFHGRVYDLSPASENSFSAIPAQNASGNFVKVAQRIPIRIVFVDDEPRYPLSDYALRPGMSVETAVRTQ